MAAALSFFDLAVSVTPPSGHFEPFPVTLGASWQPNDVRFMVTSGGGVADDGTSTTLMMPMKPDPPTSPNYTAAYSVNPSPGNETKGVYYRRLQVGDGITNVAWPRPPGWRHFLFALLTARGVDPAVAPVAGKLSISYTVKAATATVSSVTVPAAGTMVFVVTNFADPDGMWPSWPSAMGVPTGWTHITATDKSGINYYPYDNNPAAIIVGKSFASAGSTGSVSIPVGSGSPAFTGMYFFVRPAPDVSVAIGAA